MLLTSSENCCHDACINLTVNITKTLDIVKTVPHPRSLFMKIQGRNFLIIQLSLKL